MRLELSRGEAVELGSVCTLLGLSLGLLSGLDLGLGAASLGLSTEPGRLGRLGLSLATVGAKGDEGAALTPGVVAVGVPGELASYLGRSSLIYQLLLAEVVNPEGCEGGLSLARPERPKRGRAAVGSEARRGRVGRVEDWSGGGPPSDFPFDRREKGFAFLSLLNSESVTPVGVTLTPVGVTLTPVGVTLTPVGVTLTPVGVTTDPHGGHSDPRGGH